MKRKIDKLPSTIVLGVFLTIAIALTVFLYSFSFIEQAERLKEANENVQNAGQAIGAGLGIGIGIAILIVITMFLTCGNFLICLVSAPFNILNILRTKEKAIKIINICFVSTLGLILLMSIIKIIVMFVAI